MSWPRRNAFAALAAFAAVVFEIAPVLDEPYGVATAIADILREWVYIGVGLLAWHRRPDNATGPLLVLVGALASPGNILFFDSSPAAVAIGEMLTPAFCAPLAWLLLYFPDGLGTAGSRALAIAVGALTTIGWWAVIAAGDGTAGSIALAVWLAGAAALSAAVAVVMTRRFRAGSRPTRRILGPVYLASAACALTIALTVPFAMTMTDGSATVMALHWVWTVSFGIVPVAVLVGLLRTRVTRSNLSRLVTELGGHLPPSELEKALTRALGDPSLEITLWDGNGHWSHLDGTPREPAVATAGRSRTTFGDGARRIVLVHDPVLVHDEGLLESVGAATQLALRNAELQEELANQLEEVRAARARIVLAGDEARRRIERDLHDGTQQTLVSLSMALQLLGSSIPTESRARRDLETATTLVDVALDELRDLARGVYPAVLTDNGLAAALHALARTAPLPVVVEQVPAQRVAAEVEAAVYFVCREAVTNAAKHARATRVTIAVGITDDLLRVEVADDGTGGAVIESGGGLAGLADRMTALRGDLRVSGEPGRGSVVSGWLPAVPAGT